jgi:hypothetical protein
LVHTVYPEPTDTTSEPSTKPNTITNTHILDTLLKNSEQERSVPCSTTTTAGRMLLRLSWRSLILRRLLSVLLRWETTVLLLLLGLAILTLSLLLLGLAVLTLTLGLAVLALLTWGRTGRCAVLALGLSWWCAWGRGVLA